MLLLFALHRCPNEIHQLLLCYILISHGVSQRELLVAKQAHLDVAIRSESQSVAGSTKVFRHGCDETHLTLESRNCIGFGCVIWAIGQSLEIRPPLTDGLQGIFVGNKSLRVPLVSRKGHVLYKSHIHRAIPCEFHEIADFILVEVPHENTVHLGGLGRRTKV